MDSRDSVRRPSWARQQIDALAAENLQQREEALSVGLARLEKERDQEILKSSEWEKVAADLQASRYAREYAKRCLEVRQRAITTLNARIAEERSLFESETAMAKRRREAVEHAFDVVWRQLPSSSQLLVTSFSDTGERRMLALAPDGQYFVWLIRNSERGGSTLIESPDQLTTDELGCIFEHEQKQAAAKAGATT